MSKRADSAEVKSMADKPKLTRAERKQIEAVIRKYRGDGKPHTAQDTIPYQIMYPDGICYLGNRRYSQSIEFFDINYLLAQPDDQTAIFEYLCDLYNYLDSSIHVQFTYPNRKSDREQLARSFEMPPCNDGLDPIRQEQTDILKRQLARGNNGSVKTKYITYTIEADNLKAARARLSRISLDIQGYFKIMGAVSRVLDGKAVVAVFNNGDSPAQLEFQLPVDASGAEDLLADCVGSQPILTDIEWGRMKVQLPSNYATLLRLK